MSKETIKIVKIKDDTEIRIERKIFKGKERIDIREFVDSETYSGPTRKGVSISIDKFEEIAKGLMAIAPEFFNSNEEDEMSLDEDDFEYNEDDFEV